MNYVKLSGDGLYMDQQNALDKIANQLGVVAFRPSYHNKKQDANTVMFYTYEDEKHNREVDKKAFTYTPSEALDWLYRGYEVPDEYVYRTPFFVFENTDCNGHKNIAYANLGSIDLRRINWRQYLESEIIKALRSKEVGKKYIGDKIKKYK